jgi:hypothetical protein
MVHARFPATGQTLDARLTRVVGSLDSRTRTFSAIAELPNKGHVLRPGLYAEITLTGTKAADPGATKVKAAAKPVAKAAAKPVARASKD